jgi:hypothetical protein
LDFSTAEHFVFNHLSLFECGREANLDTDLLDDVRRYVAFVQRNHVNPRACAADSGKRE